MRAVRFAIAAVAAVLLCGNAWAGQLTWTLTGGTFDDTGTASGTFTLDTTSNTVMTWNMVVAGGNTGSFSARSYTPANSTAPILNLSRRSATDGRVCGHRPGDSATAVDAGCRAGWNKLAGRARHRVRQRQCRVLQLLAVPPGHGRDADAHRRRSRRDDHLGDARSHDGWHVDLRDGLRDGRRGSGHADRQRYGLRQCEQSPLHVDASGDLVLVHAVRRRRADAVRPVQRRCQLRDREFAFLRPDDRSGARPAAGDAAPSRRSGRWRWGSSHCC